MEAAAVHIPVLQAETLKYLEPREGGVYVDCTIGLGGHARAVLERIGPAGLLIGIDRDPAALEIAWRELAAYRERLVLIRDNFQNLRRILERFSIGAVDGFLFDLGVSSLQLDTPERGFSYWNDAPLDMRMDPRQPITAYHLVNGLTEDELERIIREFGEERWSRRIAQFIVRERARQPIETTGQLVDVIKSAIPAAARRSGGHPARRTFQALRIAVNNELSGLADAIKDAVSLLRAGGRICVISFHSLEDRVVKQTFKELSRGCVCPPDMPACRCGHKPQIKVLTTKPVVPTANEVEANPRARSARLRAAERLGASLKVLRGGREE